MNDTDRGGVEYRARTRVTEACAPYSTPTGRGPVSVYAIVRRLDVDTLRDMATMLAIVHPRHFETALRRSQP